MSQSPWVRLKDAVRLALYGEPISPDPDNEDNRRPEPGLLRGLTRVEQFAKRTQFDIALSNAAFEGELHFEGCCLPDAPPKPIPPTYFETARGFNTDGSILPWPYDPLAYRSRKPIQAGATWKQVVVDRIEFLKWIADNYPEVSAAVQTLGSEGVVNLVPVVPEGPGQPVEPSGQSRRKSQPALERARGAIRELYPKGVPGQAAEPNTSLCRRVGENLKQAGLPGVSDDTILRAAGRRK